MGAAGRFRKRAGRGPPGPEPMPHTLFVSDLHLDAARPARVAAFAAFLRGPARAAEALYVLGDLFDAWIGDDDPAAGLQDALAALRELAAAGVPVRLLHGNRDFLLGADFARRTGAELLPERSVIDLYGAPTLIEHGDLLCIDDRAYQRYRRWLRRPAALAALRRLPRNARLALAARLRRASRAAVAAKSERIMDVNPGEVRRVMRAAGARALIHGHTHRPAVHRFTLDGAPAVRAVLGDWYEEGGWLAADAGGLHPRSAAGLSP